MLNAVASYLTVFWQPLSGLVIGAIVLVFVGYVNWYGTVKKDTIRWIAKHIFRNEFRSEMSADGLFMVVTSFLLAIGWIMIGVAFLYLTY
jgi:hypothetical protein